MNSSNVFSSLDQTLNYLKEPTRQTNEIKELLNVYEQVNTGYVSPTSSRNHLFVVFEGLDGSGKTTMCNIATEELDSVQIATLPKSIQYLRPYFDHSEPKLRRAYYSLGNYLAGMEIEALLNSKHIFMDRFWHSTAAYALAESPADIPAKGDPIYQWPKDLLKPDKIIFLTVQEHLRVSRTERRQEATKEEEKLKKDTEFRARLYEAYNNMEGLTYIESNAPPKTVFKNIMESIINPLLAKYCHS